MATTLSSLLSSAEITDHEEVLKAANAALKSSKTNQDALHTRVVAYLKLDRFADALRALDDGGEKLAHTCSLEKAYALYKTGELVEAEKITNTSTASRGMKHIAAQVAYRAERFNDTAKIYKDLSGETGGLHGEENDLRINSSAADAQLEWQGNGDLVEKSRKKPGREDLEAFETAYNAACGYIARGELSSGSVLLKRARDLCEALDWASEEECKAEVLPIMVQQAYVFARLGKVEDAEKVQKMISISDVPEPPTRLIAQNNALAAQTHDNPYIAQRLFDTVPKLAKSESLFDHQASILERNRHVLNLKTFKYEGVARSTAKTIASATSPSTSANLNTASSINAIAHAQSDDHKVALKQIVPLLEKRPADVGLILTICQLYILANNPGSAIDLLESFFKRLEESSIVADQDVRFAPGLVALAVSLYKLQGRTPAVKSELGKAASYWRLKQRPSETLYRAAGVALLESSKAEDLKEASEIFSSLRKQDPNDKLAIAGYVASKATSDFAAVKADADKLTPVDRLIAGIDVSALENGGIATLPVIMSEVSKKRAAPLEKEKPKKKKKGKLPKDFVEGQQADPERWLPLKDRSSYRPKGKKGKKKMVDSTQGGVVNESLDVGNAAPGPGVVTGQGQQGGGKANKKKKGKK